MSNRHDDNDGSDIFWPGYVDATTNLILNLLFLLTILIIAVFMFALEMGRASKVEQPPPLVSQTEQIDERTPAAPAITAEELLALKRENERLKTLLAKRDLQILLADKLVKEVEIKAKESKPKTGFTEMLAGDFELVVRFKEDAVDFTQEEHDRLLDSLKPVANSKKAAIYVEVPVGFSEAKRLGFYRALAVRNLLIEMKQPNEKIDVSVIEVDKGGNASIVRIRSRE